MDIDELPSVISGGSMVVENSQLHSKQTNKNMRHEQTQQSNEQTYGIIRK
jgi:hypothetical protein